jgi:hypothetical protein
LSGSRLAFVPINLVNCIAGGIHMHHRQFAFIWFLVCVVIVAVRVEAQTKPAAKSITVYKTPT